MSAVRLLAPALLVAFLVSPGPLCGETAGPKLFIEKAEIDLGRVERGKEAEAVFRVRNDGTEILRILSAKPG